MSEYKIYRWDVVISGNSNQQVPMIYIKPDLTFLEFIRKNNFTVVCKINGTATLYDGKIINGIVATSADTPSCRPNFFEKTGFYVVKLTANWYGYPHPDNLGNVKFIGLNKNDNDDDNDYSRQSDNNYKHYAPDVSVANTDPSSDSLSPRFSNSQYGAKIIILIIILILFIFLVLGISMLNKSKKSNVGE